MAQQVTALGTQIWPLEFNLVPILKPAERLSQSCCPLIPIYVFCHTGPKNIMYSHNHLNGKTFFKMKILVDPLGQHGEHYHCHIPTSTQIIIHSSCMNDLVPEAQDKHTISIIYIQCLCMYVYINFILYISIVFHKGKKSCKLLLNFEN